MEMAQAHRLLGAQVTLLQRSRILRKDDPELVEVVRRRFNADGIKLLEGIPIRGLERAGNGVAIVISLSNHFLVPAGETPSSPPVSTGPMRRISTTTFRSPAGSGGAGCGWRTSRNKLALSMTPRPLRGAQAVLYGDGQHQHPVETTLLFLSGCELVDAMIEYVQVLVFQFGRNTEPAAVRAGHGHLDRIDEFTARQEQQGRNRTRNQFLGARHQVMFRLSKGANSAPHLAPRALPLRRHFV